MLRILPVILIFISPVAVQADTQITIKDMRGGISDIVSDGKNARMNEQGESRYSVAKYKSSEFFHVDPDRKEVMSMDMNAMPESTVAAGTASQVVVKLNKKGKGPKVAGYKTKEFELTANEQYCGTIFGSKKLLKKKGVSELFEFLNQMRQQTMKMTGAFRGTIDICEQAMQDVSLSFKKTGAPMRMLDANGNVESEVIKVKTGEKIDPAYYDYPADYKVVSVADQMNAASQQSQQMMEQMGQNMPNMEELMKQIQSQGGQMPPELIEQIQKMKDEYQNYQQQ